VRSTARATRHRSRLALPAGGLVLVAGTLASAAGMAADASGSSVTQAVRVTIGYDCQFPGGARAVPVTVAGSFPRTALAGQPIQPSGLRLAAQLPSAVVAGFTGQGASSVIASQALTVAEAMPGRSATATWSSRAPADYPLPASGPLLLDTPATAPAASPVGRGTATFSAAALSLTLGPRRPDGTAAGASPVTVACSPATAGSTRLAAVQVAAPTPSASASASPPGQRGKGQRGKHHRKKLPPGCGHIKVVGTGVATCGYITGYSDVAKLYGAALLQPKRPTPPGLVNLDFAEKHKFTKKGLVEYSTAELYYHGLRQLPPVTATFLAFRFVPVTATLNLVELTPIRIVSVSGIKAPPYPITVRASTKITIRVSDVRVNGVPLDVGSKCRTATPTTLVLIGKGDNTIPPKGYTVPTGGPLTGEVTIPRFTGCGVTENLDPILTGSISGSGNFVKMTQGKLCGPSQPANWTCPPPEPKPER